MKGSQSESKKNYEYTSSSALYGGGRSAAALIDCRLSPSVPAAWLYGGGAPTICTPLFILYVIPAVEPSKKQYDCVCTSELKYRKMAIGPEFYNYITYLHYH